MKKLLLFLLTTSFAFAELSLIPKPLKIEEGKGYLTIGHKVTLSASKQLKNEAKYFQKELLKRRSIQVKASQKGQIRLTLTTNNVLKSLGEDGYTLTVGRSGIEVKSVSATGVFNGLQTIFQLIPTNAKNGKFKVPFVKIEDKPRFSWRAAHLDVSRHFYNVDQVKRYIDFMAMHKMNIFHWHLTDHQGWRVQIDAYPKLTELGAWRRILDMNTLRAKSFDETVEEAKARLIKEGRYKEIDDVGYFGGFYTKKDIKDIIAYAKERHIEVMPEIDIPGHTQAVIASYPELQCTSVKKNFETCTWMGLNNAIMCPGTEKTDKFLDAVFKEVLELFPCKYIHIGADESHGGINQYWKNCDHCKARLAKRGSKDFHDLQVMVIDQVSKIIKANNRIVVGWGEAFYNGIDKDMIIMSWWGTNAGERAARHGNKVVMTPHYHLYFNSKTYRDQTYHEVNKPIEQIYKYDPAPMTYSEQMRKNIIGSQPCLWSEFVPTNSDLEFRTMPNNIVAAEMAWTMQDNRSLDSFMNRLNRHYPRLDVYNVRYYVAEPKEAKQVYFNDKINTRITSAFPKAKIVYKKQGEKELRPYKLGMPISKSTTLETYAYAPSGLRSVLSKIKYQKVDVKPSAVKPTKVGFKTTTYKMIDRKFKVLENQKIGEGTHDALDLPKSANGDHFVFVMKGFLKVDKDKVYTMKAGKADDGLAVKFLGKEVIHTHDRNRMSVRFALKPGYYPIEIQFFEIGGAQYFDLDLIDETGTEIKDISNLIFH